MLVLSTATVLEASTFHSRLFTLPSMHATMSTQQKQARMSALQAEVAELQKVLGEGVNADEIVAKHIKLLHHYNEAKDAAQILIGRLAMHRGTTIREIHEEHGLTNED